MRTAHPLAALGILTAALAVSASSSGAPSEPVGAEACAKGSVRAVVDDKRVCLKVGQRCKRSLDRRYHRYGFHCHSGRLIKKKPPLPPPRDVKVEVTGPPEVVFDWTTDRCDEPDIPDLPARAFRDADGKVQLISTHFVNRRFVGPDLGRVERDCAVVMDSGYNADPAAFDDREWIASTWTPDGTTIYALVHDEYQGDSHPGQCPSADYVKCWYNAITLAVSRDRGRSYVDAPPPKLVASIPYRYVPDNGPNGMMSPSNIVRHDGFFYALTRLNLGDRTFANCLIRTKNLADAGSWRAWSGGKRFDTSFVDPYGPNSNPGAHLCRGVSPSALRDLVPGTITYNSVARQWLLVGILAGGFHYSVSRDLVTWSYPRRFMSTEAPWTYECGDPDPAHYPALIDPSSTSRNFETSDGRGYVYYTQFHYDECRTTLDRDLVRVPVAIRP